MHKIDGNLIKQAQQMRNEGLTTQRISEILGISKTSVSRLTLPADGIRKTKIKDESRSNGAVTIYRPDYRRSITPNVVSTEYTYGGIAFKINDVEQSLEISTENIKVDELYCISDIDDLKQLGEALVGISMFFEDRINKL